jgi:hypothetical protein
VRLPTSTAVPDWLERAVEQEKGPGGSAAWVGPAGAPAAAAAAAAVAVGEHRRRRVWGKR